MTVIEESLISAVEVVTGGDGANDSEFALDLMADSDWCSSYAV